MMDGFSEFTVGGVFFAPFVPQSAVALALYVLVRPLLRRVPIERIFANPPLIGICLYVAILALVMVFYG